MSYTKGFLEEPEDPTDGVERQTGCPTYKKSHIGEVADRHLIPTPYYSRCRLEMPPRWHSWKTSPFQTEGLPDVLL